jgi:hypothetical protein
MAAAPVTRAAGFALALAACGMLGGSPPAAAETRAWNFRVFLDDAEIGQHRFTLRDEGNERVLHSDARFAVKIAFITAYRYLHDAQERWRGNCLAGLKARTNDDGKSIAVDAALEPAAGGERLVVTRGTERAALEGCMMTFAYWNPEMLKQARLINSQTGETLPVKIAAAGEETIVVRGAPVAARRYRVSGAKNPIDLWYSIAGNDWLALESTLENGRRLRYRLE